MVIDNWRLPCKYHIGNLEDIIYLQSFDDKIEYYIDDAGEPYCSAISGALSSITCESVLLTEESSFDTNRFAFTYELTAVFREGNDNIYSSVLKLLRENKYRLYVKTTDGMYYLINAEYPYSLSYEYVWSNTSHHCTLKFTLNNNIPTMKCTTFPKSFTELIPRDCGYFSPRINEFNIIEEKNVLVGYNASELNYTQITTIGSNTWKTVEHLDDSFVYTHTYSGGGFSNTIQFDIELSDYLTTFHYNILEFVKNRYVVKFKSSLGNTIIVGDKCGLFPSFSLNTSDTLGSLNRIRITLRENTSKDASFSSVDVVETVDDSKKHGGTSDNRHNIPTPTIRVSGLTFPTIECISPTMAKRILMPQINVNGDETGKYYVLDGYQDYFGAISDLIIGTYDENTINNFDVSLYVTTNQCQNDFGCLYSTTLNDRNYLINSSSSFFAIISSCGWQIIQKDACLTFDRLSGDSGVQYVVDYSTSCAVGVESSFTIKVGDDEYTYIIKKVDTSTCFINNQNVSIVASAATLTFEMSVNANEVAINGVYLDNNDTDLLKITLIGNTMTVAVPEYTDFSGYRRYFTIRLESNSGGNCEVEIIQDHPYKKQVIDLSKYECLDGDKYYVYQYYSGYTLDTIDTPTGEYYVDYDRSPWERNSPDCTDDELIKWFDAEDVYYCETTPEHNYEKWSASTEYICDGTDKYVKDVKMVSDDGETWSATTDTRMGDLIEHNSADCGFCPKQTEWRDDTAHTICDGVSLRYVAYLWESNDCGETWSAVVPSTSGNGTVISEDTVDCGGTGCTVTGDSGIQYKWVDNIERTICLSGNSYYVSEQYFSNDCGNSWEKTGSISIGELSESGATECSGDSGTTETRYKWEDSTTDTICVGGDSYYISYRYVSNDSGSTWTATGESTIGTLKQRNANECADNGSDTESRYKWVDSTDETICLNGDSYYISYRYVSTDGGENWQQTGEFTVGSLKELNASECSTDTGTTETRYKWEDSATETVCVDGDLYYVSYRYVSTDSGITWTATGASGIGTLKEADAKECESTTSTTETWYKWETSTDTICVSGDSYYIRYRYVSSDSGSTWTATGDYAIGSLKESNAKECESTTSTTETWYKWEDSTDNTICVSGDSYYVKYKYVSTDSGETWTATGEFTVGSLKELNASECSDEHTSGETLYKWVQSETDTTCVGYALYYMEYEYSSDDNGHTWVETGNYRIGELISSDSDQCKEQVFYKWEDTEETTCFDGDLYYKCYKFVSHDGIIWARTNTWRLGTLIEKGAAECAECQLEYKWIASPTEYICDETTHTKYEKLYYYWSDDCWETSHLFEDIEPISGDVIEYNSFDCGYKDHKWVFIDEYCYDDLPEDVEIDDDGYSARTIVEYDYECSGTTKITTATTKNQETYDSGATWITLSSTEEVSYEENSEDCLYTKWEYDDDYCYNDLPENTEIIDEDINNEN